MPRDSGIARAWGPPVAASYAGESTVQAQDEVVLVFAGGGAGLPGAAPHERADQLVRNEASKRVGERWPLFVGALADLLELARTGTLSRACPS